MKKFSLIIVAGVLVASCSLELENPEVISQPSLDRYPISVEGSINQVSTKATASGFVDGDALGLYAVNYENNNTVPGILKDEGNQADHVKYVFDEPNYTWKAVSASYYKDPDTHVDIYCYYPYAVPASVTEYSFEVSQDQGAVPDPGMMNNYEASDFLWAKVTNVAPTESKIKVKLGHKMAGISVVLQEGSGFLDGEFDLLSKSVLAQSVTRQSTINLATGEVTPVGEAPATGTILAKQSDGSYRGILVPQTVVAGNPLLSITVGGKSYTYKESADNSYISGKLKSFVIAINKKVSTGEFELELVSSSIDEWIEDLDSHDGEARQYYVAEARPSQLGNIIRAAGMNPKKIKNLKVTGTINEVDFRFMRDTMAILEALNLKEVKIYIENPDEQEWGYDPYGQWVILNKGQYSDRIPRDAFSNKTTLFYFAFPESVSLIGSYAFYKTSISGQLIIPDSVKKIENDAFAECRTLTGLTLPNAIEYIGDSAFRDCNNFNSPLVLPNTVTYIGYNTFSSCGFTGQLKLPEHLKEIKEWSFYNNKFVGSLEIPDEVEKIGSYAFHNCGFTGMLTIPASVKMIGENAFGANRFRGELVLPEELTAIENSCFESNEFSFVVLPKELKRIGNNAFNNNWRLLGVLEIPEGCVSIGNWAFSSCRTIEKLVLPSTLQTLSEGAFNGCEGISSIVCKAVEVPNVVKSAFDGVAKDNFTVEVPQQSVTRYQSDAQWGEFRRIAAHFDFSISRSICRALNNSEPKTYTLRVPSGMSWSIKSKPSWVTVYPESGTGKTDVTVVFNGMRADEADREFREGKWDGNNWVEMGARYRAGEIVFVLDEVDYTSKMTVEQYNYGYGDGDVIELNKATKGKGINVVFMGDCYDAKDIATGTYLINVKQGFTHFFDLEPYKTYKEYFNAYLVFGESKDSGMGSVNTVRDARFGSAYATAGLVPDSEICYKYAKKTGATDMSKTLIVLAENTAAYSGVCYMWEDGSAIAVCPVSTEPYPYDYRGIIQHEAGGHGFGKLLDEYIYHNAFISGCNCCCCNHVCEFLAAKALGWGRNMELNGDMHQVGWSHLIFHPKYSNVVDVYEGGYFHSRGVFRSESVSCMNNNIPYYSAISRQAIVERIMDYAGEQFSIDDFIDKDVMTMGTITKAGSFVDFTADEYPARMDNHEPVILKGSPRTTPIKPVKNEEE